MRSQRDNPAVADQLAQLESAARTEDNLLPPIIRAVEAYASVGEISDVFRKVHGEYREAPVS
jgi:methylmalonyl-CoA mutase, N-terminal domain